METRFDSITTYADDYIRTESHEAIELPGITVFGEISPDGSLAPKTLSLLAYARQRADTDGTRVTLVLTGRDLLLPGRAAIIRGADRVFLYEDAFWTELSAAELAAILDHFLSNYQPEIILSAPNPLGQLLTDTEVTDDPLLKGKPYFPPDPSRKGELIFCEMPRLGVRN